MIYQVSSSPNSIGLICVRCKAAQLQSAPVVVRLVNPNASFRVNAPEPVLAQLRAGRFNPGAIRVDGTITGGVIAVNRVLGGRPASRLTKAPPEKIHKRTTVERTAPTGHTTALKQLGITPAREAPMIELSAPPFARLSQPRPTAPSNEARAFVHKKIGGFIGRNIGTAISLIPIPGAPIVGGALSGFAGAGGNCGPGTIFRNGRCEVVGIGGAIERFIPGGQPGAFTPAMVPAGGGCPSGMHPNKSSYFTMEGFVEKGTKCVSNRRRNNLNPRAATRAASRLVGFTKDVKRVDKALRKIAGRR